MLRSCRAKPSPASWSTGLIVRPVIPLPIDGHLTELVALAQREHGLVLEAEPGAGKTTRFPPALLEAVRGEVWVLEPRRLAARLAAQRVASERGEEVGGTVGYEVRFDRRCGPKTRLRFLTEGVLTRRLAKGGDALKGVSAVILDEFHERHLDTDLALVLLERLRRTERPDLLIVLMSATIDTAPLAAYLEAPARAVPGRVHPVDIDFARTVDRRHLEDQVYSATDRLIDEGLTGHVLCFLPGVGEIRRCERALGGLARRAKLELFPLHGRLEAREVEAALRPGRGRKVILATNVAESSLTIDGVEAVIDVGLARVPSVNSQSGLPTLRLSPISRASAIQRAHRAGRQGPGRCLRLYTQLDYRGRPAHPIPALLREDLASLVLALRGAGVRDLEELRWLDEPPPRALTQADTLLQDLGAVSPGGALNEIGQRLERLPLPVRAGRVFLEAARRGLGPLAADAAALLSERSLRTAAAEREPPPVRGESDLLWLLDLLGEARRARFRSGTLRGLGVDAQSARSVDRVAKQLERQLRGPERQARSDHPDLELRQALLVGHPDRVAKRQGGARFALAGGGGVQLAPESTVQESEWLVVLDAGASSAGGAASGKARLVSAIEADWLLDAFPDGLSEASQVRFDEARGRVESQWELSYGALVVERSPEAGDPVSTAACLAEAARAAGPRSFCDAEALDALLKRLAFLGSLREDLPTLDESSLMDVIVELCEGRSSFAELREAQPLLHLTGRLGPDGENLLRRLAPTHVGIPGRKRCQVNYERQQPPWISSRLQDFFGLSRGPELGGVPLVLHLLAPNKVAVSITSDLAGFWERTYPREARALRRRYPRHSWPEDPATAEPPAPRGPRKKKKR